MHDDRARSGQDRIPYREIDVQLDTGAADELRTAGRQALPVVDTGTTGIWTGFRPDKIRSPISDGSRGPRSPMSGWGPLSQPPTSSAVGAGCPGGGVASSSRRECGAVDGLDADAPVLPFVLLFGCGPAPPLVARRV